MKEIIGFTATCADLLHPGHMSFFEEAHRHCDHLIVGFNTNVADRPNKNKPVESVFERYMRLRACKFVDEIICYENEEDLKLLLSTINMDVRFLGTDYVDKDFTGKDICEQRGIKIEYLQRFHPLSTTALKKRVKECTLLP